MSKKTKAAAENDVDAMLEGNGNGDTTAAPAKKTKKATPAIPAVPPKKGGTKKATPATPAVPAKKAKAAAKAEPAEKPAADSALRKALLKVKKAVSYGDFAEANGFNIRSVRRTARAMRDAGEIDLSREGQIVYISAAV